MDIILFVDWCEENEIELAYIKPSIPQHNGFSERFNGSFRREFLNVYLFENLNQVRDMAWVWQQDYNNEHPQDSLGNFKAKANDGHKNALPHTCFFLQFCHVKPLVMNNHCIVLGGNFGEY